MGIAAIGTLLVGSIAASTAVKTAASYSAASASNKAAEYNAQVGARNAEVAELQATSALEAGSFKAQQHRLRIARLKGKQRASFAAAGVVVDQDSALDVLEDTAYFGEQDALVIRHNAALSAWGFRTQAAGFLSQSELTKLKKVSPLAAAGTSFLSGVSDFSYAAFAIDKGV